MNRQKVFNKVARHLLTQKAKSVISVKSSMTDDMEERCAYRGTDGKMCAIGCLIPEDVYHEYDDSTNIYGNRLEGNNVLALPFYILERALSVENVDDRRFLQGLQSVHDSYYPEYWRGLLREFASTRELDSSILDEFVEVS